MTAVDRTPSVAVSGEGVAIIDRPTPQSGPRSGSRVAAVAIGLVVPVALLVAWWAAAATESVPASILPPPVEVLDAARRLSANGSLWEHLSTSLVRVATGFAIGAGLAVVIGIAVGLSPLVDRLLTPSLLAIRAVPSLAWVPLLVLWVGIGEQPKVILIAIGAFFPVLATLVSGLRQVDPGLMEVARTYGLSPLQRVRTVLLPTAAPSLLAGARLGLAQAWLFLVAAELLGASAGLGFLLVNSQGNGQVDVILMTIVLLAVIGKLTDAALGVLESRVIRRLR